MYERDGMISRMLAEFPYLSSPLQVIDIALELAELSPKEVLVDLGCGDGVVLLRAVERFGVFSVGFELDPGLLKMAKRRVKEAGFAHMVDLIHADIFRVELSRFKVIYVYPSPFIIRGLTLKLMNECPSGTRILVHDHPLEGLKPLKSENIPSGKQHIHTIYLYVL